VIRLFNVYYPVRTLVLLVGEVLIVWTSFLLATLMQYGYGPDSYIALNYEGGYYKILGVTVIVVIASYWFDLYDPAQVEERGELYFRLLLVPGLLALLLAAIGYRYPNLMLGKNAYLIGLVILTISLFAWRAAYHWLVQREALQDNVYVLGIGERSQRLVQGLRLRSDLGMRVVSWTGEMEGAVNRESLGAHLLDAVRQHKIHHVIVALADSRGTLPVKELLHLRLQGVKIEEATSLNERISGKIEVEHLYPSWLIYAEGFRFSPVFRLLRRVFSLVASLLLLLLVLPVIPLVILAIKLDSRGPLLYKQARVGRGGLVFHCYKFRTMRPNAEADTGPTWAGDDDPRITRIGKFLRKARLDEVPQLWNVLRGDMAFVGPRPERPEFVEWLTKEIPYYPVRHVVRPGITGWAQVRYRYGNTVEDAKEKLQFDLFYIKNRSMGLDFLIMFQTVKTVLFGRGAR
jgi:sugar transferase (PEP-CTERM system associated)